MLEPKHLAEEFKTRRLAQTDKEEMEESGKPEEKEGKRSRSVTRPADLQTCRRRCTEWKEKKKTITQPGWWCTQLF